MNTLCVRLQDVNEAGAYRLNCPLNDLLAAVAQAGFTLFEADLAAVHDKGGFLDAMAQAVHAPSGFGNNWDALADVLGDLSWSNVSGQPASGYVLLLRNGGEAMGLPAADLKAATEVLADTVSFWKSQGKPFWAFRC
jgi:hypothetical protein